MGTDGQSIEEDGVLSMPTGNPKEKFDSYSMLRREDYMIVDGRMIPYPKKREGHYIVHDNGQLYCDGYKWVNGKWKISLKAIINRWTMF